MKKFISTLCATSIALSLGAFSASAAPLAIAAPSAPAGDVINVQSRRDRQELRQNRREFRREARQDRREFRREAHQDRREFRDRRFMRRNGFYYYGGYRGYRDRRPGYREYNGYWFPLAAFAAGAVIGGAINSSPPAASGSAHVQWCYDRYRSYRASDNTFQPYNGPRQQCYSPYS